MKLLSSDVVRQLAEIQFPFEISNHQVRWNFFYEKLVAFNEENPDRWPRRNSGTPEEVRLANWCMHQVRKLRAHTLSSSRVQLLEALGFSGGKRGARRTSQPWRQGYGNLLAYRKEHPEGWPTKKTQFPPGYSLGRWCRHQRYRYRKKDLGPEQVQALRRIRFPWVVKGWPGPGKSWEKRYRELVAFRKEHPNRWPGRRNADPAERSLTRWGVRQRERFRKNLLTPSQRLRLEKLGFPWKPAGRWDQRYAELIVFRKEHPNRWPGRRNADPAERSLTRWGVRQRERFRQNLLAPDQRARLDELIFPWNPDRVGWEVQKWDQWYAELIAFRKEHPDRWPRRASGTLEEMRLANWCSQQGRLRYSRSLVEPLERSRRNRLLEAIGFPWKFRFFSTARIHRLKLKIQTMRGGPLWIARFDSLCWFRQEHPDRWPRKFEEFPEGNLLGSWCDGQCWQRRQGSLPRDKVRILDQINFPWTLFDKGIGKR